MPDHLLLLMLGIGLLVIAALASKIFKTTNNTPPLPQRPLKDTKTICEHVERQEAININC